MNNRLLARGLLDSIEDVSLPKPNNPYVQPHQGTMTSANTPMGDAVAQHTSPLIGALLSRVERFAGDQTAVPGVEGGGNALMRGAAMLPFGLLFRGPQAAMRTIDRSQFFDRIKGLSDDQLDNLARRLNYGLGAQGAGPKGKKADYLLHSFDQDLRVINEDLSFGVRSAQKHGSSAEAEKIRSEAAVRLNALARKIDEALSD